MLAGTTALTVGVAGETLGYDFLAYHAAASRVLEGAPAYDTSFQAAGGFGLFYYPPTFVPVVLPFGLLPAPVATWAWTALLLAAFLCGVALLPVSARTRWLVVLLAGLSWPFLYALKLGQVGHLLFLAFAAGWRALEAPAAARHGASAAVLGAAGALGTAVKIQPGLVLAWALLAGRWRAVATGAVLLLVFAAGATLAAGPGAWTDFLGLVGRVGDPIDTPRNLTPGAVARGLGLAAGAAAGLQWAVVALVAIVVVVAAVRLPPVPSYLVAVVASQLLSPILWDHYALLLLLPVAWLLDRGHRWAVLIPLATSLPLVGLVPPPVYPLAFGLTLPALLVTGGSAAARPTRAASDVAGSRRLPA